MLTFGSSIFASAYESEMSRSLAYQKSPPTAFGSGRTDADRVGERELMPSRMCCMTVVMWR